MTKNGVVTLIEESPDAHGVFDEVTTTERQVFCTVKSAGLRDIMAAGGLGLKPEIILRLPHDFEYQGERICRYAGTEYNIDRTYVSDEDWIELTCSRRHADV